MVAHNTITTKERMEIKATNGSNAVTSEERPLPYLLALVSALPLRLSQQNIRQNQTLFAH
jgi:hypothetical protein